MNICAHRGNTKCSSGTNAECKRQRSLPETRERNARRRRKSSSTEEGGRSHGTKSLTQFELAARCAARREVIQSREEAGLETDQL